MRRNMWHDTDCKQPVTIILRQGVSTDLKTLYNLTSTSTGGSFVWTPRTDLPNGADYALQIMQGNQTNYYGPFRVQGYLGPLSSSASSASSTSHTGSITSVGAMSTGTGIPMSRNTTFSSATLSSTSVTTSTVSTTASSAAASASGTGAANPKAQVGSSLALVGAIAALLV